MRRTVYSISVIYVCVQTIFQQNEMNIYICIYGLTCGLKIRWAIEWIMATQQNTIPKKWLPFKTFKWNFQCTSLFFRAIYNNFCGCFGIDWSSTKNRSEWWINEQFKQRQYESTPSVASVFFFILFNIFKNLKENRNCYNG